MFRFRLYLPSGRDIGTFETPVPNWVPGETIVTDDGRRWFLLSAIAETEPGLPFDGYLEVEPLDRLVTQPLRTALDAS